MMDQGANLPPIRHPDSPNSIEARYSKTGKMTSGSMQLPPLHEILAELPPHDPRGESHLRYQSSTSSRSHPFPDAQSLAPSLGRQPYRPPLPTAYPTGSSTSSELSDHRSSYASPSSSTSIASAKGSPNIHGLAGTHHPYAPDHRPVAGLPPLYGNGDSSLHARNAPLPHHHQYSPPYNGYHADYTGPYHLPQAPGTITPNGSYPVGYEGMADYGDGKQKRRRGNLPKAVTDVLRQWFLDHNAHPYPTEDEKQALMSQTGLTMSQISNWFINARRRNVTPLHR